MGNLKLYKLASALVVVALIYGFLVFGGSGQDSSLNLNSSIKWDKVRKVSIEHESKNIEIVGDDNGSWVIPSKDNFPASTAAIRSFLLKLMDISTSQKVQVSPSGLEKLGLNDSGKQSGHGIITLSYGDKEAAKVYLGALRSRKGEGMEEQMSLSGQYVKYSFSDQVFMLPLAINLQTDAKSWLKTELFSISSGEIYKIDSVSLNPSGEIIKVDFSINREDDIFSNGEAKFVINLPTPQGKIIQTTTINQITSALENFNFENVYKVGDETLKDVSFSKGMVFNLLNGARYLVKFGKKDAKTYIKLEAQFNSDAKGLMENLEKEFLSKKAEDSKLDTVKVINKKIDYINVEKIETENKAFSGWVYEIPEFVASRFNKVQSDFFKDKPSVIEK